MKKRTAKETDQENTGKAYQILMDMLLKHQGEIEPALWIGAMMAALAANFKITGIPKHLWKKEMLTCLDFYESKWDDL